MTSEHPRPEAYAAFSIAGRLALRVPVHTRTRVVRIIGKGRVEAVEIENLDSGDREVVACDTVVFTGDWVPDNELFRAAGLPLDQGTLGPIVDTELQTGRPGIFAAGNVLHPVDTADVAALDGVQVTASVLEHLAGRSPSSRGVRIVADEPLRWVSPMLHRSGQRRPARRRLLAWANDYVSFPEVIVHQDDEVIARRRLPWPAAPGRMFRVPDNVLNAVRSTGGEVRISVGPALDQD